MTKVEPVIPTEAHPANASTRLKVVVIENSPYDLQLIKEALDLWTRPHDLISFSNGPAAVEALRVGAAPNERILVLLDWNLPGFHGSKVLREIRSGTSEASRCFVVVFTSSSSEVDRKLSESLGADLFMTKAIDLDDFFYSILQLQSVI